MTLCIRPDEQEKNGNLVLPARNLILNTMSSGPQAELLLLGGTVRANLVVTAPFKLYKPSFPPVPMRSFHSVQVPWKPGSRGLHGHVINVGHIELCQHSSRRWTGCCGDTVLKYTRVIDCDDIVLFETGGRNVEEGAAHWCHVGYLSRLNASSDDRVVVVTRVPGGTRASLALRRRQPKQDETRRVCCCVV